MAGPVVLRLAETVQQDIGLGTARIDGVSRRQLGVEAGDIIEIRGKTVTGAIVELSQVEDEGKGLVRAEFVVRQNAGASMGESVQVKRIDPPLADAVTIAPDFSGNAKTELESGLARQVTRGVDGRPFVRGDVFILHGVYHLRQPLLFRVVGTTPDGIVKVGRTTSIVL